MIIQKYLELGKTVFNIIINNSNNITTMATTVQFKAYISQFVRNEYRERSDAHKLNEEELKEVLQYKNISENFEYNDWYGSSSNIKATLVSVEKTKYSDLIFTIEINKNIPKQ